MPIDKIILAQLNFLIRLLLTSEKGSTVSPLKKDIEVGYAATGLLLRKHFSKQVTNNSPAQKEEDRNEV